MRILALDYGKIRTGIAVTDMLQIIASGLTTVASNELMPFLDTYFSKEKVEKVIIGNPRQMDGSASESAKMIQKFCVGFRARFPNIQLIEVDERFSSKMAQRSMIDAGLKKKQRQNKALFDEIAAAILLRDYLSRKMT